MYQDCISVRLYQSVRTHSLTQEEGPSGASLIHVSRIVSSLYQEDRVERR